MTGTSLTWLLAVHISDGVLTGPWVWGGFLVAAALLAVGSWRVRDEEIPPIALFTAAFFVASSIRVPLWPTSAHLLLNGLLGVLLGTRVCVAIPVGLFLQAVLLAHGAYSTLGVNSCVMVLPALLAGGLFAVARRAPALRRRWFRSAIAFFSFALWGLSLVAAVGLLVAARGANNVGFDLQAALETTAHPLSLTAVLTIAAVGAWLELRMETAPEFPVGLLIGMVSVLFTLFLNGLVLVYGGTEDWRSLATLVFVAHLPIAMIESIALGFTLHFLARVKPDSIGWPPVEKTECPADALT